MCIKFAGHTQSMMNYLDLKAAFSAEYCDSCPFFLKYLDRNIIEGHRFKEYYKCELGLFSYMEYEMRYRKPAICKQARNRYKSKDNQNPHNILI